MSGRDRSPAEASVEHPQARFRDRLWHRPKSDRSPHWVEATGWVRDEVGNVVLVAAQGNDAASAYWLRAP